MIRCSGCGKPSSGFKMGRICIGVLFKTIKWWWCTLFSQRTLSICIWFKLATGCIRVKTCLRDCNTRSCKIIYRFLKDLNLGRGVKHCTQYVPALFGCFQKFLDMTGVELVTDTANLEVCSKWCCQLSASVCLVFLALHVPFVNTCMYIVNNSGGIPRLSRNESRLTWKCRFGFTKRQS